MISFDTRWLLAGWLLSGSTLAAVVNTTPAVAPPGGGQSALAVGFDTGGQLRANVCRQAPCSLDGSTAIATPPEAAALVGGSHLRVVRLGLDRTAVVVEIPDLATRKTWTAIVAAPLAGTAPLVVFSGYTGFIEGVEGERIGPTILVRDEGVYVGTEREGRDLCGRPAVLAPEALDPETLTLKPAKLQRLSEAERAAAPTVQAKVIGAPPPPALLRAEWATSAAPGTTPAALTDGDSATEWAENRGGAGRGEFAVLAAPREVPISAFEIALAGRTAPHAAVPRELWVATEHELFHVVIPEEPRTATRYEVPLPAPVNTACVAVVLEKASADDKNAIVSVSEIWARPVLSASVDDLVRALGAGAPNANTAAALLRAQKAFAPVAAAFPTLNEDGRRAALDLLDAAPCDVALPVYIDALTGPYDAHRMHARSALGRCEASAAPAFVQAMDHAPDAATRSTLAQELVSASPATGVRTLIPKLAKSSVRERRAYRAAIARAAEATDVRDIVSAALDDPALDPHGTIDLLRALGPALPAYAPAAERAFARVSATDASFRARFLLALPAAALANTDGTARTYLRQAITVDPSPIVRAEAARALVDPAPFGAELSRALDDPSVRVREAAVRALAAGHVEDSRDRIVYRLKTDDWSLVRIAAAESLARFRPDETINKSLGERLEDDESVDVRRAIVGSLGARRATSQVAGVRRRLTDKGEAPSVRSAAAAALGELCDLESLDALTEYARRLGTAEDEERTLAQYSLASLAAIHPNDLEKRLGSLEKKDVPPVIRQMVARAIATPGRCTPRPPGAR